MNAARPIVLVLLPGMHGSGQLFAPLLRELTGCIKPQLVSYPSDRPLDYQGHLEVVMAALPVDEPFILLGESFSGPLALMAAARKPKGLCGVILCATFVTWPVPLPVSIAGLLVSAGVFRMKSTHLFLRLLLGKSASQELKTMFAAALAHLQPEVLAARARAVMGLNCTAALRECHVPLMTMVADHDRIVGGRYSEVMHSIRPDTEIVHFKSPHLILQCAAVEAAQEIQRFVETVTVGCNISKGVDNS